MTDRLTHPRGPGRSFRRWPVRWLKSKSWQPIGCQLLLLPKLGFSGQIGRRVVHCMKAMIFDREGVPAFRLHLGLAPVSHKVIVSAFFKSTLRANWGFSQAHDFRSSLLILILY